jgi:capsular polysaccharide biosynthesis protein
VGNLSSLDFPAGQLILSLLMLVIRREIMEEEISLGEIFAILKQRLGSIIMWSMAGLLLAALYTFFFVTPTYQSTSKIVVNQTQNAEQAITNTDIQTNLSLINTYQGIIKEPIILEDVITNTGSKLTVGELRNKLTVQTEDSSLVFGITVADENPFTAAELANATASSLSKKSANTGREQRYDLVASSRESESGIPEHADESCAWFVGRHDDRCWAGILG